MTVKSEQKQLGLDELVSSLKPYHIEKNDVLEWQQALGLERTLKASDNGAVYQDFHLNLFKTVKKHLALGRSLNEIRSLLVLPPVSASQQQVAAAPKAPQQAATPVEPQQPKTAKSFATLVDAAPVVAEQPAINLNPQPKQIVAVSQPVVENPNQLSETLDQLDKADYSIRLAQSVSDAIKTPNTISPAIPSAKSGGTKPQLSVVGGQASQQQAFDQLQQSVQEAQDNYAKDVRPIIEHQLKRLKTQQYSVEETLNNNAASQANVGTDNQAQQTGLLVLIDRLVNDKDDLSAQLAELSRHNSHLTKVNQLYENQLEENSLQLSQLRQQLEQIKEQLRVNQNIQLLDTKSKLQQQLIAVEAERTRLQSLLSGQNKQLITLQQRLSGQQNPLQFVGQWVEQSELIEIQYDTVGINIPKQRRRQFKLSKPPVRLYGNMAVVETSYDYRTNSLWKRRETMTLCHLGNKNQLEGELLVDYTLEGRSVARALYKLVCTPLR